MRHALALLLFLFALTVRAEDGAFTAELDKLSAQDDLGALIKRVNEPRTTEEMKQGLAWLRARTMSGIGGSRMFYSYAGNLYKVGIKETAGFAYLVGLLFGRVDAARCADPSAPGDKLVRWDRNLQPIFQYFVALPLEERKKWVSMAITMEAGIGNRAPDPWLCTGGLSYMRKFMEKHKDDAQPPAREIQDDTRVGRTILLDDPDIKPEYVADDEWKARRQQIVARFVEQLPAAK